MGEYYILDGKKPRSCDVKKWSRWWGQAGDSRRVKLDRINDVSISTVFLGINHNFEGGRPLLFETMIFGGPHDQYQDRCSARDEAEAMHAKAVALVSDDAP